MSDNNLNSMRDKDEVDLIDLIIILIKYRFMIILTCFFTLVILVFGYFYYPSRNYNRAIENQLVDASMVIAPEPAISVIGLEFDLKSLFTNSSLLYSALKEAGYTRFPADGVGSIDLDNLEEEKNAMIKLRQYFSQKQDFVVNVSSMHTQQIPVSNYENKVELKYRSSDPEMVITFLNSLYQKANSKLFEILTPQLQVIVDGYEHLLSVKNPNDELQLAIINGQQRYGAAKRVLEGNTGVLYVQEEPYFIKDEVSLGAFKSSYLKKAIVLEICVLFLSILFSFILNAINRVKNDEVAMEKIRRALKKD